MHPSQHSIPIHRAANRPVLLLGCDRELIGLVESLKNRRRQRQNKSLRSMWL